MSSKQISLLQRTWYKWKALRLPWRKRFLVGLDLQGNTYWEFCDVRHAPATSPLTRWRRIVQYPRGTPLDDVSVPPQWHQWLRHVRERPPSVAEQRAELQRQRRMQVLAAEADARWAAKPGPMDAPPGGAGPPLPVVEGRGGSGDGGDGAEGGVGDGRGRDAVAGAEKQVQVQEDRPRHKEAGTEDPRKKQSRGGPSEDWQPQAWTPPASKR